MFEIEHLLLLGSQDFYRGGNLAGVAVAKIRDLRLHLKFGHDAHAMETVILEEQISIGAPPTFVPLGWKR